MIPSILGAVIISTATVAMLIAIDISDQSISKAGKHPLTPEEINRILKIPGFTSDDIINLQADLTSLSIPPE